MARKKKNTVDYFPHLIQGGKTMFIIESKYKNDGYATWFKILERLGKSENHFIDLSDNRELMYLASKCNVGEDLLKSIINDLVDLGKFDKDLWKQNIIWSQDFVDNISPLYERRDSNLPTKELICHQLNIKCKHNDLNVSEGTHSIVKDINIYNRDIIAYLNTKANKLFKYNVDKTKSIIQARLNEGFSLEDFKKVIDVKVKDWLHDEKFNKYLRPITLFSNKFESYLAEANTKPIKEQPKKIPWKYDKK